MTYISGLMLVAASAVIHTALPMSSQAQVPSSLEQRWTLARLETEAGVLQPVDDAEITAEFDGERVAGSGGCNRYTAGVTVDGDTLTIGPVAATRRACPEAISTREFQYFNALDAAQRYTLTAEGELRIDYQTEVGSGTLVYTPSAIRALW